MPPRPVLAVVVGPARAGERAAGDPRRLLPHLAARAEVEVFVESGREGVGERGVSVLEARRYRRCDHLLYLVEDHAEHAFMARLVARLGGTVALAEWGLSRLAHAAWPELARGGVAGRVRAWREGGRAGARAWRAAETAAERDALVLNRSVVRRADAFLVADDDLARRVLEDRNAPTPVAVVGWPTESDGPEELDALAGTWLERLAAFPGHRSARRSLVRALIEASDRERAARRAAARG